MCHTATVGKTQIPILRVSHQVSASCCLGHWANTISHSPPALLAVTCAPPAVRELKPLLPSQGTQTCFPGAPASSSGAALWTPRPLFPACRLASSDAGQPWFQEALCLQVEHSELLCPPGTWSPNTLAHPHSHQVFNNVQPHPFDINFFKSSPFGGSPLVW